MIKIPKHGTSKMVQWVKVLVPRLLALDSILGPMWWEERTRSLKLSSDLRMHGCKCTYIASADYGDLHTHQAGSRGLSQADSHSAHSHHKWAEYTKPFPQSSVSGLSLIHI